MRQTESAEGKTVRLLRVGEQVRHILSEVLTRGGTRVPSIICARVS